MLEPNDTGSDKPKISRPKPTIASKPKYIPPVNLKVTPKTDSPHSRTAANGKDAFGEQQKSRDTANLYVKNIDYGPEKERAGSENVKFIPTQHQSFKTSSHEAPVGPSDVRGRVKNGRDTGANVRVSEITRNSEKLSSGAPNSPSTVCCSILSNSASDCCGIMGNKKEITSKSMTKIDSLDSNSSDSGGFKDFIQLDSLKKLPLDAENGKYERKYEGHQRKFSQPEFLEKSVSERAKTLSQSFCDRKSTSEIDDNRKLPKTEIGRLPMKQQQSLVQNITPTPSFNNDKTDDSKNKQKPQIISHGQFKQSTKMLEEILAQRLEKEKQRQKKAGMSSHGEGDNMTSQQYEQQMAVQKQIQQKLHADLKQTVKQIQEIQSIELRLPQNKSWDVRVTNCT